MTELETPPGSAMGSVNRQLSQGHLRKWPLFFYYPSV